MPKSKVLYCCSACGHTTPKWLGRCGGCDAWNSYHEELVPSAATLRSHSEVSSASGAGPLSDICAASAVPVSTGINEFDRVLGGGLVPGSVTLVGGEPGIGKSTLLAQVALHRAVAGEQVLYVSAEESPQQVSARLNRIGEAPRDLWLGGEANLTTTMLDLDRLKPSVVVIDSIQTVFDPELASAPGSVAQVRHCAHRLARIAKARSLAMVLVGQVTKDGGLAGPRVLEHLVDTVITFEGDRDLGLRLLRATKHRYGPTGEIGVFEMTGRGIVEVGDPSKLLLGERSSEVPGSVIAVTSQGQRPIVVEIQALVTQASAAIPRRFAQGIDQARVAMLLAVLAQRGSIPSIDGDVYASVVGGLRLRDPGTDLALVIAFASATTEREVDANTVVIGEVGLAGEVRSVPGLERRLSEANRLGFARAVVPLAGERASSSTGPVEGIEILPVATVAEALRSLGMIGPGHVRSELPDSTRLAVA